MSVAFYWIVKHSYRWIVDALQTRSIMCDPDLSTSLVVGSQLYVEGVKDCPGIKARNRKIESIGDRYSIREESEVYDAHLDTKNYQLSADNGYYLKDS